MSIEPYKQAKDVVLLCEADFVSMADRQTWAKESRFALSALQANSYLAQAATKNLDSLRSAIINIAATGLTLNPIKRHAYLVPRDGRICLDIGYLGYCQLAYDSGVFSYVKAEIVCEKDVFIWHGIGNEPDHQMNPFSDRGAKVGAYCVAKMMNGDFVTEMMTIEEIFSIRDRSKSYQSGKNSPWKSDENEMIKKTVIKRAYKSWPIPSANRGQLEAALESDMDELEESSVVDVSHGDDKRETLLSEIRENIFVMDREEAKTVDYCAKIYQRKISSLEELTTYEAQKLNAMLLQHIEKLDKEHTNQKREDYRENKRTDSELTIELPADLQLETD
jgi:recombination protein RecT